MVSSPVCQPKTIRWPVEGIVQLVPGEVPGRQEVSQVYLSPPGDGAQGQKGWPYSQRASSHNPSYAQGQALFGSNVRHNLSRGSGRMASNSSFLGSIVFLGFPMSSLPLTVRLAKHGKTWAARRAKCTLARSQR